MDISIYVNAAVAGTPLLFLVFGLVEVLKRLRRPDGSQLVTGNGLLLGSLLIGLVTGLGYTIFKTEPPAAGGHTQYVYWFAGSAYGLGLGILASLFFETVKGLVDKAIERLAAGGIVKVIKP